MRQHEEVSFPFFANTAKCIVLRCTPSRGIALTPCQSSSTMTMVIFIDSTYHLVSVRKSFAFLIFQDVVSQCAMNTLRFLLTGRALHWQPLLPGDSSLTWADANTTVFFAAPVPFFFETTRNFSAQSAIQNSQPPQKFWLAAKL